ncbi:hypothetical protein ANCCAN_05587 [Ancylostoma caninum]|uniref:Uncharacterized protein n=1 Tax=Ancylostoma caninum TaxID=29170 RepID=A0A368GXJ6_ANCCA|nr:hypothetical protein ANCCAN_05587 [Ancylostoma caninum]
MYGWPVLVLMVTYAILGQEASPLSRSPTEPSSVHPAPPEQGPSILEMMQALIDKGCREVGFNGGLKPVCVDNTKKPDDN